MEVGHSQGDAALRRLESLEETLGESPEWMVQKAELLIGMERQGQARRYLAGASKRLGKLRETPARRDLAKRISVIQGTLDRP